MPERVKIEKADYLWDEDRTLVALTAEVHQAMRKAMAAHAWPFLEELAVWDHNNPDTSTIHFAEEDFETESIPACCAIHTLQGYMPMLEAA